MSIIILTPPPKKPGGSSLTTDALAPSPAYDVNEFDTFEQLRDFAQAQIDAAAE